MGSDPILAGLYVHVPFCAARCSYCAFVTWTDRGDQEGAYFDALLREIESRVAGLTLDTVYFGGGTPSLAEPARLRAVMDRVRSCATLLPGAEVTLECNPESVDAVRAAAWREAGIHRASVGAQSFDGKVLATMQRLHGPEGAPRAFAALRGAGFDNLSLDLIAGLPGETRESVRDSRRRAINLAPQHVSLYMLELDEAGKHSPLAAAVSAGRMSVPSDDEVADWYEESVQELESAGLRRYEISNFAHPGRESRHNLKYWRCEPVIGAGVAAHGFDGERRRFNVAGFEAYVARASRDGDAEADESRAAPPLDLAAERVMLALRLRDGVASREARPFSEALDRHVASGLLERAGERLRLTARGVLLSNEVFQDLVGERPPR